MGKALKFQLYVVKACGRTHERLILWQLTMQTLWAQIRLLTLVQSYKVHIVCFHGRSQIYSTYAEDVQVSLFDTAHSSHSSAANEKLIGSFN